MLEQHDYIILGIVGVIIFLQAYVFIGNLKKINTYKKTIDKISNFEIVEVVIPEERIRDIEVAEILHSPEAFQNSTLTPDTSSTFYEEQDEEDQDESLSGNMEVEFDSSPIYPGNSDISKERNNEPASTLDPVSEELNFPEMEYEEKSPFRDSLEVEEFEEEDFEIEDEKNSSNLGARR